MEGPPLGPGGEDITWPDQVAPWGRKASSTRKIKPQTSNLSGLGGRECSGCVHSVDDVEVGLHSPLLVELQLFVLVIRAAYFSAAKRGCTNRPYLPTCKAKAND